MVILKVNSNDLLCIKDNKTKKKKKMNDNKETYMIV